MKISKTTVQLNKIIDKITHKEILGSALMKELFSYIAFIKNHKINISEDQFHYYASQHAELLIGAEYQLFKVTEGFVVFEKFKTDDKGNIEIIDQHSFDQNLNEIKDKKYK